MQTAGTLQIEKVTGAGGATLQLTDLAASTTVLDLKKMLEEASTLDPPLKADGIKLIHKGNITPKPVLNGRPSV